MTNSQTSQSDLELGDVTLSQVMTHPWVMENKGVKYPDPTWLWGVMARTRNSSMWALWPWPWRYDLGSRSWPTIGSWTTIVWNYIQIRQGSTKLWPGHDLNRRTERQTDGRTTGWFLYTPQLCLRGYNNHLGHAVLAYEEHVSKAMQGGLQHRKIEPKQTKRARKFN